MNNVDIFHTVFKMYFCLSSHIRNGLMGKNCVYGHERATLTFFISKPRANIYKIGRFIVWRAQAAAYFGSQGLLGNMFQSVILLNLKEKRGFFFMGKHCGKYAWTIFLRKCSKERKHFEFWCLFLQTLCLISPVLRWIAII